MNGEEALISLFKSFGVPTALSIAIVVSIWRAMSWTATNILKPLADRQLKFMDDLESCYQKQSAAIESVAHAVEAIRVSVATQEINLQRLLNNGDRQSKG